MSEFAKKYQWWLIAAAVLVAVVIVIAVVAAQQEPEKVAPTTPTTLTPRFNVKDYGAKGDGATNDEAAILRAVKAARGAIVYFPAGNYLVKSTFKLPRLAVVKGDKDPNKQSYLMVITPQPDGTVTWKFTWIRP